MSADRVKFIKVNPDPDGCARNRRRVARTKAGMQRGPKPSAVPTARLAYLAGRIHSLGERPLYELLRELEAGAPLRECVERYAELDSGVVKALGADRLPPSLRLAPSVRKGKAL